MRGPLDPLDLATVFLSPWWPSMQMRHVYDMWMSFGFDALRRRAGKNRVCRAAEVRRLRWPTVMLINQLSLCSHEVL